MYTIKVELIGEKGKPTIGQSTHFYVKFRNSFFQTHLKHVLQRFWVKQFLGDTPKASFSENLWIKEDAAGA